MQIQKNRQIGQYNVIVNIMLRFNILYTWHMYVCLSYSQIHVVAFIYTWSCIRFSFHLDNKTSWFHLGYATWKMKRTLTANINSKRRQAHTAMFKSKKKKEKRKQKQEIKLFMENFRITQLMLQCFLKPFTNIHL